MSPYAPPMYHVQAPRVCAIDRFEGPPEGSSRIPIFPLFDGSQVPAEAGTRSVNEGRLGPPESD